jgi:thioredoxin-related protein
MMKIVFISLLLLCSTLAIAQESFTEESALEWYSMQEAQKLAKDNNKKVLIFGDALWCGYCKRMKSEVYPDSAVISAVQKYFYPVLLDSDSEKLITFNGTELAETELARAFRLRGTPTHYFIGSDGRVLGQQPGFIPADIFEKLLSFVGSDAYLNQSFDDYEKSTSKPGSPD